MKINKIKVTWKEIIKRKTVALFYMLYSYFFGLVAPSDMMDLAKKLDEIDDNKNI